MTRDILVSLIDADPAQPRTVFAPAALGELAASLAEHGQLSPVLLRPDGERYTLIHGERRWRAAQSLGWPTIRAEVRDVSAEAAPWLALAENLHRADLTPLEEAHAYAARVEAGATQGQIAQKIGRTQSYIAHKLRLLRLPDAVLAALADGRLTEGHARQLLRLDTPERQQLAAEQVEAEGLSVRALVALVDRGGPLTRAEAEAMEGEIVTELTRPEADRLAALEAQLSDGLARMEADALAAASHVREVAARLTREELYGWGVLHDMHPAEIDTLLAYTGGPVPDLWLDVLVRQVEQRQAI